MSASTKTNSTNYVLRQQVALAIIRGEIPLDAVTPMLPAETPAKPAAPAQPKLQPAYHAIWNDDVTTGPADLYQHLAVASLTEFMPILDDLSDQTRNLVFDAAKLAVDVVCRAANVPTSWDNLYQDATEHLRK